MVRRCVDPVVVVGIDDILSGLPCGHDCVDAGRLQRAEFVENPTLFRPQELSELFQLLCAVEFRVVLCAQHAHRTRCTVDIVVSRVAGVVFEPLLAGTTSRKTAVCDEVSVGAARMMCETVGTRPVAGVAVFACTASPVGGPVLGCVNRPEGKVPVASGESWTVWIETYLVRPSVGTAFSSATTARALVGRLYTGRPVGLAVPSCGLPASAGLTGASCFKLRATFR